MEKTEMKLIKDMYFHLFNSITDALPYIRSEKAIEILKQAQINTEEMYMNYPNK